jgi:hypothetical protein
VGQDSQTTMGVVAAAPEINAPSACWATEEPQLPGDCPSPRRGLLTGHSLNGRCQDGDHSMVRPVGQIGEWMKLWGGIATMSCRIDWPSRDPVVIRTRHSLPTLACTQIMAIAAFRGGCVWDSVRGLFADPVCRCPNAVSRRSHRLAGWRRRESRGETRAFCWAKKLEPAPSLLGPEVFACSPIALARGSLPARSSVVRPDQTPAANEFSPPSPHRAHCGGPESRLHPRTDRLMKLGSTPESMCRRAASSPAQQSRRHGPVLARRS